MATDDHNSDRLRPRWRPKTAEELAADRRWRYVRRLNPLRPLMVAGIFFGLIASMPIFMHQDFDFTSWTDWLVILILAVACAVFAFAVTFFFQLIGAISMPREPRMQLCPNCCKVRLPSKHRLCECGTPTVDLADWTLARCPSCDYDLRGTPDRCPECGRILMDPDPRTNSTASTPVHPLALDQARADTGYASKTDVR